MKTHVRTSERFFGLTGLLLAAVLLFVAACDTAAPEAEQPAVDDANLAAVAEALAADLELSPSQSTEIRQVLARHADEGAGALWKVAAELDERLTDEQKARLFARASERRRAFRERVAEGAAEGGRMHRRRGRAMGFLRGASGGPLAESLTEEQKTALAEARQRLHEAMLDLQAQRRDGAITPEAFRAEMKRVFEEMRTEIEALLTDEQKAMLENRRGERRETFRGRVEMRREAMAEALGLTDAQAEALEALREKHREAVHALIEGLREDPSADPQALRTARSELREAQRKEMAEVLTDEQIEIVRLHRILAAKVMARHRAGEGVGAFRHNRRSGRRNG